MANGKPSESDESLLGYPGNDVDKDGLSQLPMVSNNYDKEHISISHQNSDEYKNNCGRHEPE